MQAIYVLRLINRLRWRYFLRSRNIKSPIVLIVIPGLEHLCVPCARLLSPFFLVAVVSNGLNLVARQWLSSALPNVPIFPLITTYRGFEKYTLPHGQALQLLSEVPLDQIFIDPDCYIFDPMLIVKLFRSLKQNAIASLYSDPILGFSIPDTFCFGIQSRSLSVLRKAFSLRLGVTSALDSPLLEQAVKHWGSPVPFPHPGKLYFDTIHSLAISAYLQGMGIDIIPSSEGQVYHVCGTSYLVKKLQTAGIGFDELTLNAHYFHCLIAECFSTTLPNSDVRKLFEHYGGSKGLLEKFPSFSESKIRATTDELLSALIYRKACFCESKVLAPS